MTLRVIATKKQKLPLPFYGNILPVTKASMSHLAANNFIQLVQRSEVMLE